MELGYFEKINPLLRWLERHAESIQGSLQIRSGPITLYLEATQLEHSSRTLLQQYIRLTVRYRALSEAVQLDALKRLLLACNPFRGNLPLRKVYLLHGDLYLTEVIPLGPLKPNWRRQLSGIFEALLRAVRMEP